MFQVYAYYESISFVTCMKYVYIKFRSIYLNGRRAFIFKQKSVFLLLLIIFICAVLSYSNLIYIGSG